MAKILVIDDNGASMRLALRVLLHAGHVPLAAASAGEGLEIARREKPDLVLMDLQLPGMDGLEATRRLRADPATATLRIVALTALAMKGDRERILEAGCDDYLAKPYRYPELLDVVARALKK